MGVAIVAIAAIGALVFFIIKSRLHGPQPLAGDAPKPVNGDYYASSPQPSELGYYGPTKEQHELVGATARIAELS